MSKLLHLILLFLILIVKFALGSADYRELLAAKSFNINAYRPEERMHFYKVFETLELLAQAARLKFNLLKNSIAGPYADLNNLRDTLILDLDEAYVSNSLIEITVRKGDFKKMILRKNSSCSLERRLISWKNGALSAPRVDCFFETKVLIKNVHVQKWQLCKPTMHVFSTKSGKIELHDEKFFENKKWLISEICGEKGMLLHKAFLKLISFDGVPEKIPENVRLKLIQTVAFVSGRVDPSHLYSGLHGPLTFAQLQVVIPWIDISFRMRAIVEAKRFENPRLQMDIFWKVYEMMWREALPQAQILKAAHFVKKGETIATIGKISFCIYNNNPSTNLCTLQISPTFQTTSKTPKSSKTQLNEFKRFVTGCRSHILMGPFWRDPLTWNYHIYPLEWTSCVLTFPLAFEFRQKIKNGKDILLPFDTYNSMRLQWKQEYIARNPFQLKKSTRADSLSAGLKLTTSLFNVESFVQKKWKNRQPERTQFLARPCLIGLPYDKLLLSGTGLPLPAYHLEMITAALSVNWVTTDANINVGDIFASCC